MTVLLPNGVREVAGHPSVETFTPHGERRMLTVCSGCGEMRTIIFLSNDRWFCTKCRAEGDARPTVIPLTRGKRR